MKDVNYNNDEFLPLRDVVFKTLRQSIIQGDLKPGERLMEIQLAQKMGVSRTPVREAIRKLELEGLVIMTARRGAEVAPITENDLTDVLEVRKALECLAAEIACDRITQEELEELKRLIVAFKDAIMKDNLTEIAKYDVKFHESIYAATRNKRLIQMLNNLREHIYRYRLQYIKDSRKRHTLIEEHTEIVNAIAVHDKETARKIMKTHIERQEKYIIEGLKNK